MVTFEDLSLSFFELAWRMKHGARRIEEIKGNYYLMSKCFMGEGKNEWRE
jgi:hypothetical protein